MIKESITIGHLPLHFESGAWAPQTNASVVLRAGQAVVLVTVVAGNPSGDGAFVPLTVDYREKFSAFARIPGAFGRREARPSDAEVLASRLIDRSLRPLFPKGFNAETVITATVYSADPKVDIPTLTINAASLALSISDIPWEGPVAALRVAGSPQGLSLFPAPAACDSASLDFVVSVGQPGILMVEGGAAECTEAEVLDALLGAQKAAQTLLALQSRWQKNHGIGKRTIPPPPPLPAPCLAIVDDLTPAWHEALANTTKAERRSALAAVKKQALDACTAACDERDAATLTQINHAIERSARDAARAFILAGKRFDGRQHHQVRHIHSEVRLLPSAHGSALFTRGETQALATTTLGGPRDSLRQENLYGSKDDSFFLHYNFPPFSVGEARAPRTPGRREIGHGALAQRALRRVIPSKDDFPYTIRVVSDILSSNGSSSMATVCAGCLSLMDAGVPLSAPVAGVAMGLIVQGEQRAILTDILGDEDHLGDMDFKVCGTRQGITALQMDLKIEGLSKETLTQALDAAQKARLHILDRMLSVLPQSRTSVPEHAVKVLRIKARKERIGDIIGPGGAGIRHLASSTGTDIDIDDQGWIRVAATDPKAVQAAQRKLMLTLREPTIGEVVPATIARISPPFMRLELFPGTEASLHFADLNDDRSGRVDDRYQLGDVVMVKILGVDDRGNIRVSHRSA